MNKDQRIVKIILLFIITLVFLIPQIANAYDQRLNNGLLPQCTEGISYDLLNMLKENFPQYMIDDSESFTNKGGFPSSYWWDYGFADLDGIGDRSYLVVMYASTSLSTIKIFKKVSMNYSLVWTAPFDLGGITEDIYFRDLDNDNKPEIIVFSHGMSGGYYGEAILKWNGSSATLIMPYTTEEISTRSDSESSVKLNSVENNPISGKFIDYYDLDRNGKLDAIIQSPVFDSDEKDVGTTFKVYQLSGAAGFTYKQELQASPFIKASIKIKPGKWNLSWLRERKDRGRKNHVMGESQDQNLCIGKDDDKSEGSIKVYIGNLAEGQTVNEVKLDSIRLNEKLAPSGKIKVKTDKDKTDKEERDFQGKYLIAEFDKNEAIGTISEPQKEDFKRGDKVNISISGQLNTGKFFIGSCEIELEGTIR